MAKATVQKKVVETVEGVTLELTKAEAEFLVCVLGNVAGNAFYKAKPGAHLSSGPGVAVFEGLKNAGVEYPTSISSHGECYFEFKSERAL